MKKYYLIFLITLSHILCHGQANNVKAPVQLPVSPAVWEFAKYGNVPVSEYRGLVNISIPIYNISVDKVILPLNVDYQSGGIRVTDEASMVGLGWSFNLPTIIQQIKDKNDYQSNTIHQKLPPYQGNPAIPSDEVYPLSRPANAWSTNINGYMGVGSIQNVPYFINVCNAVMVDNTGYYNTNSQYLQMFNNSTVDSEPDIFSLNLNGVEIKFCREESAVINYNNSLPHILPLKIMNGRTEYKVELISGNYNGTITPLKIAGIKVTDPSGNKYFFDKIESVGIGGTVTQLLYKPTKIITAYNKEINFNYSSTVYTVGVNKYNCNYIRRKEPVVYQPYPNSITCIKSLSIDETYFSDNSQVFFSTGFGGSSANPSTTHDYQQYSFLNSIETPNENIIFFYSDRIDYLYSKKMDAVEIKNKQNVLVKKYNFNYDYFDSNADVTNHYSMQSHQINPQWNYGMSDRFSKRLKLLSIQEQGSNPYTFVYNSTPLPKKNTFSIDYWGFYNGHNNLNFYPDLTELGYPAFTENIANDFNSHLNFCKAGSLEKIIYPTKGYTEFDYELHQFDNLLYSTGPSTPVISSGGGLRIKKITNKNHDDTIINEKGFEYFGGKCISKRLLTKEGYHESFICEGASHASTIVTSSINNFIDSSSNLEGQYIGYNKVVIKELGSVNKGKVEKEFYNSDYDVINTQTDLYARVEYYDKNGCYKNGNLLKESTYNSTNDVLLQKINNYIDVQHVISYGMSKQPNGYRICISGLPTSIEGGGDGNYCSIQFSTIHARMLATFYPISSKNSLLSEELVTEYFNGNSKTILTNYTYNSKNNINNVKVFEAAANAPQRNVSEVSTNYMNLTSLNQFDLPGDITNKENNVIKDKQVFTYDETSGYYLLKKIESFLGGDINLGNSKMNYDLYDDKNNIVQYHAENGIYTCIIWGYNKTLPIAKLENILYSGISTGTITQLQTESNNDIDINSEIVLKASLNALRTSYPNAMITTFTHNPLVGVTTITDPKGDSITYTYDALGRLQNVKDKNGNILTENQYNYKP